MPVLSTKYSFIKLLTYTELLFFYKNKSLIYFYSVKICMHIFFFFKSYSIFFFLLKTTAAPFNFFNRVCVLIYLAYSKYLFKKYLKFVNHAVVVPIHNVFYKLFKILKLFKNHSYFDNSNFYLFLIYRKLVFKPVPIFKFLNKFVIRYFKQNSYRFFLYSKAAKRNSYAKYAYLDKRRLLDNLSFFKKKFKFFSLFVLAQNYFDVLFISIFSLFYYTIQTAKYNMYCVHPLASFILPYTLLTSQVNISLHLLSFSKKRLKKK